MKRFATGILLVSLALGAAACGDDGDDDADAEGGNQSSTETIARPTEGVEAEVATAAEGYFAAFTSGDAATTRTFLSARCSEALPEPGFTQFIEAAAQQYPDIAITAWRTVEVDGDTAQVDYDTGVASLDSQPAKAWVNENGGWKYDGC